MYIYIETKWRSEMHYVKRKWYGDKKNNSKYHLSFSKCIKLQIHNPQSQNMT